MKRSVMNHRKHCRADLPARSGRKPRESQLKLVLAILAMLAITVWSYRGLLVRLFREWLTNNDYSAGSLVPLIAVFLLWRDRKALKRCPLAPCWWGGITLLVFSQVTRGYGYLFMDWWAMNYAIVLTAAGLALTVAGWCVFRRVFWILLFLFLMFPLTGSIHNMISSPLQRLATTGSVFLLEVFGPRVTQYGNVVVLSDNTRIAVAEACTGLRMLTAFIIVAAFVAFMVKRPRWHKGILVVSSIPIGVACNIVRIFLTAMIIVHVSAELGEKFFHDFAGWVMMPIAVSLIFGEIWLMDQIVEPDESVPVRKQKQVVVVRSIRRASAKTS